MIPHSIRWRLPLSYAAVAFTATLALSLMLVSTLQVYFRQNEASYLDQNARVLSTRLAPLLAANQPNDAWKSQAAAFAFLLQTRVEILDPQGSVLVDSGLPAPLYIDVVIPSSQQIQNEDTDPYLVVKRQPFELGLENETSSIPALPTVPSPNIPVPPQAGDVPPPAPPPPPVPSAPLPTTNLLLGFVLGPEVTRSGARSNQHTTAPILDPATQQTIGFVTLSDGPAYGRELVQRAALVIVVASVLATAIAAVVGWWASRRMTTPLLELTQATTHMANGNLAIRADTQRQDEIGVLALSFNGMAQRIEETVSTLRRFVADAAHELNTPLTALRTHLELALDGDDSVERDAFLRSAENDVDRLEQLANDLLDLSRIEDAATNSVASPVDLVQIIRELEELYISRAEQKSVQLAMRLPHDDVFVHADAGQVRRVLINVLDNALKFTPSGGSVSLDIAANPKNVVVTVQDTGIGIPPADVPHIFSRFHRARNTSAFPGSGLGLAIVKAIMDKQGGDVTVESNTNGTRFTFRWPRQSYRLEANAKNDRA